MAGQNNETRSAVFALTNHVKCVLWSYEQAKTKKNQSTADTIKGEKPLLVVELP